MFVSSTIQELAAERAAAREAIEALQLVPVLFELGARPHPPEELYRAYLDQSHVFVGVYWQSYGWLAPGASRSGIEHEYELSAGVPRLLYVKEPAPDREPRLAALVDRLIEDGSASFTTFADAAELGRLLRRDLALLITERFAAGATERPARALPFPVTSFVGRGQELAAAERLICHEGVRLLTLTGPGGIGKTRLAIEAARRVDAAFPDGTVFVPLEGVRDEEAVQTAIASAIGARDLGGDPVRGLCAGLHGRRLLLVLDNFEQVIGQAPLVATLLESSPELVVLVTSRERLHLRGEHELQVPPLSTEAEAVALFVERAAAARHAFELGDADVPLIAEICRRLDGVPLAIEIAAPRLRLMSVAELLDRLSRRLALAGPRDAPERQRTLEAAIAWSYELLSEDERRTFDRLGVFRASFTLDAAAEVCETPDPLDLLASLLDKSIVYRLSVPGETRFAMLTMIREYALERLQQTGELEPAMERLHQFHLRMARAAEIGLRSAQQGTWTRGLDFEVDNLRGTLTWLVKAGRMRDVVALLRGFWLYPWRGGHIDEFRSWLRRVLSAGDDVSAVDRGWVIALDGLFAFLQGDYATAIEEVSSARSLLEASDDRFTLALTGGVMGVVTAALGDYARARDQIEASRAEFEALGERWGVALTLDTSAWLQTMTEHYDQTDEIFQRALAAADSAGDGLLTAMALVNLSTRQLYELDIEGTRSSVRRAIELLDGAGIVFLRPDLLENLSLLAVLEDLPELAAERLGAASALREEMRVPLWGAALERVERRAAELRETLGQERFEAAVARGREARFADVSAPPDLPVKQRGRARARSRA